MDEKRFIVSRLWREGRVILPNAQTKIEQGDRLLVITTQKQVTHLTIFFGQIDETNWNRKDVDWNALDSNLISQRILITRPEINCETPRCAATAQPLRREREPRAAFGHSAAAHSRPRAPHGRPRNRGGRGAEHCRSGERIGQRGETTRRAQHDYHIHRHCHGAASGAAFPLFVPGMDYPVKLGLAGGPIVMGILIGAFGPRFHMGRDTTTSANLMMRSLGLSMYLACLGLDAGKDFLTTVMQPSALWWIGIGFAFTIVPVVIMSIVSVVVSKKTFATTAGMLCGAICQPHCPGLRQRHTARRQSLGGLCHSVSAVHVPARHHSPSHSDALAMKSSELL